MKSGCSLESLVHIYTTHPVGLGLVHDGSVKVQVSQGPHQVAFKRDVILVLMLQVHGVVDTVAVSYTHLTLPTMPDV